jgi:hypothetical protein
MMNVNDKRRRFWTGVAVFEFGLWSLNICWTDPWENVN